MQGMATARSELVDNQVALYYHLVSTCVRQSWLCGIDRATGKDYSHRKAWLVKRIEQLARCYAVEVMAYTVMSNHFHLVVLYDPLACLEWSDEEVVRRWTLSHPKMRNGVVDPTLNAVRTAMLLEQPEKLQRLRQQLGSLSCFMQHLKQPIAWRANREDECRGHFFEARFYSGALLSEDSVIAAMAYVDLNPVRAKIARSIEQCENTSIIERLRYLENSEERLEAMLSPLVSGLQSVSDADAAGVPTPSNPQSTKVTPRPLISNAEYVQILRSIVDAERAGGARNDEVSAWIDRMAEHRRRKSAYGSGETVAKWRKTRGLRVHK